MIDKRENKTYYLPAALLINALFLFIVRRNFSPWFLSNDDYTIMHFVSGNFGVFEAHTVYLNVLPGLLLNFLYMNFPSLPWYTLLQYFLIFISFTAIFFVSFKRCKILPALPACLAILVFFGLDAYICIHYTKTTAIAALAGLYLLFYSTEISTVKSRRIYEVFGICLALSGAMLRSMQFFACGAICCFIILDKLIPCIRCAESREHALKESFKLLRPFICLVALAVILLAADKAAYSSDEWKEYLEYNEARTAVTDFDRLAPYEQYASEYETLGISETLYQLTASWDFLDTELIGTETFRAIEAFSPDKTDRSPGQYFSLCIKSFLQSWAILGLIPVAFAWLICGRKDKTGLVILLSSALTLLFISFTLFVRGRHSVAWVDYGWLLAISLCLLWLMPGSQAKKNNVFAAFAAIACGILLFSVYFPGWESHFRRAPLRYEPNAIAFARELDARPELIMTDTYFEDYYISESPFSTNPAIAADNIVFLGGWQAMYPPLMEIFGQYGVSNPYRDCVDNDKVLLLTAHIELTLEHIRENYCPSARAVAVCESPERIGYELYKIIS